MHILTIQVYIDHNYKKKYYIEQLIKKKKHYIKPVNNINKITIIIFKNSLAFGVLLNGFFESFGFLAVKFAASSCL